MSASLPPPTLAPAQLVPALLRTGHALLTRAGLAQLVDVDPAALLQLSRSWNDLPADAYLRDGGRYRRRRHACCVIDGCELTEVAHRAHWQPVEYNALHGGIERWFEPIQPATLAAPAWSRLVLGLAEVCSAAKGAQRWYVEAHQFRIDTTDGIGRPTPEGAHRDGVDFVAVALVGRAGVRGGETRVFDARGPRGIRFTMTEPWTLLMLDDEHVIHETTPIQPLASVPGEPPAALGHRDTLVLTFRRGGFQGPPAA